MRRLRHDTATDHDCSAGVGLALIDPSGAESRLEPIGPALFELPTLYDGIAIVRFAFVRDSAGGVSSLNRLIYGSVVSWARSP
jgi:hypothetical protein